MDIFEQCLEQLSHDDRCIKKTIIPEGALLCVDSDGMVRSVHHDMSLKARITRKLGKLFGNEQMEEYGLDQSPVVGVALG